MEIINIKNIVNLRKLLEKIDVSVEGIDILEPKSTKELFYIKNLRTPAANILKQDCLSIGADLAVPKNTIMGQSEKVDAVLIATSSQLKKLTTKEKAQRFGLKELAMELKEHLKRETFETKIMGIINANDDSFFDKSRFMGDEAIKKIKQMIDDGADMIDIGGVSSRPGSLPISVTEELQRVKPIIDEIYEQKLFEKTLLSIDSFQPNVIEYALQRGFKIVNDITGLSDNKVCEVVAKYDATVVIMHKQGESENMQKNPTYENLILEIDDFFKKRIAKAQDYGIKNIILDVGIGFGKTLEHNLKLLNFLPHFQKFGYEILIGASRKSMIDEIVKTPIDQRLAGTLAIHLNSINRGASIVRCHDVKEHFQAIKVFEKINNKTFLN